MLFDNNFDKDYLLKKYREKHVDILDNYVLLTPMYVIHNIQLGDVIRYSTNINKISCTCAIVYIEYDGVMDTIIDKKMLTDGKATNITDLKEATKHTKKIYNLNKSKIVNITVKSVKYGNSWKIQPHNCFIFKYMKVSRSKKKNFDRGVYIENSSTIDLINKLVDDNKFDVNKLLNHDPTLSSIMIKKTNEKTNEKNNESKSMKKNVRKYMENKPLQHNNHVNDNGDTLLSKADRVKNDKRRELIKMSEYEDAMITKLFDENNIKYSTSKKNNDDQKNNDKQKNNNRLKKIVVKKIYD
jgi:hypothetical protein